MRVHVIAIVVDALGNVFCGWKRRQEELEIGRKIETIRDYSISKIV